ncbi:MAG: class I SAM-dependent methyltransferase [Thermoplasmata archaeon]
MLSKKFDSGRMSILEGERRKEILDVEKILEAVGHYLGDKVADIGCGPGYFSIPISKRIRPQGEVYAIDTEKAMLDRLKENIVAESGIRIVQSQEESIPKVPDSSVDSCLMVNVLHELEGNKTLQEAYRILRPGGYLVLVDWKKIKMEFGPPYPVRISEREAIRRCEEIGFRVEGSFFPGQYNYGVVLRKPEE